MRADWSVELLAVRGSFSPPDALWQFGDGKIFKLIGTEGRVTEFERGVDHAPGVDARPRGRRRTRAQRCASMARAGGRDASGVRVRGQAEGGGLPREDPRREEGSSSSATSSGPGEIGSDAAVRSSSEEGFNIALVELAAEMERELARRGPATSHERRSGGHQKVQGAALLRRAG